jgi:hypothetical protein
MARPLRVEFEDAIYHVCGHAQAQFLDEESAQICELAHFPRSKI